MSYLIPSDYFALIQPQNLNQVKNFDQRNIERCEAIAISEAMSYLNQRYDCAKEFYPVLLWSPLVSYLVGQKVYMDGTKYDSTRDDYASNDLVSYNDLVYRSITGLNPLTPNADAVNWQVIGVQYQISQVKEITDTWVNNVLYDVLDSVIYQNKTYICLAENIGFVPTENQTFWGAGVDVVTNSLPTTNSWTIGDTRNAKIVQVVTDITLYHLHTLISPQNIPEIRMIRYNGNGSNANETGAIGWLKMIQKESINSNLPESNPIKGLRTRFGSDTKNINSY